LRLVASLKAGVVAPSAMLKKLAAYERQNQLDLARLMQLFDEFAHGRAGFG
jgi:TnpA family transposase